MEKRNQKAKLIETRVFDVAITDGEDTSPPKIVGYPAVFNRQSEDLDGFIEVISPGAFDQTLREIEDLMAKFNHSDDHILGRISAGTLKVSANETGLRMEIDPPDVSWANDLMVSMRRGDITGGSFAFRTVHDHWTDVDGVQLRFLDEVSLAGGDVSVVSVPAYPDTSIAVRALNARRVKRRYWAVKNLAYLAELDMV